MSAILAVFLGAWASLFPERWRQRLRIESGLPVATLTWITGLAEIAIAAVLVYVLIAFETRVGLIAPFLCVEGLIRALAGLTGTPCGIFVLWLADRLIHGSVGTAREALARPPLIDVLDRHVDAEGNAKDGKIAYVIRSSHDHGWAPTGTIELQGKFWHIVASAEDGDAERPFRWSLGPLPTGWVGGGVPIHYDPRAHIKKAAAARSARHSENKELVSTLLSPPKIELGAGIALLIAPLVSFLPARTRSRFALDGVPVVLFTFLTGIAQVLGGLTLWTVLVADQMLFSLRGMVAITVILDGVARSLAGFSGHACGSLPIWIVEHLIMGPANMWMDAKKLAPIADVIEPIEGGFVIQSCKRRAWTDAVTLVIHGNPHRIVKLEERGGELRPWIYTLRPTPKNWVDRKWIEYRPDLVLDEDTAMPHARDAPPG